MKRSPPVLQVEPHPAVDLEADCRVRLARANQFLRNREEQLRQSELALNAARHSGNRLAEADGLMSLAIAVTYLEDDEQRSVALFDQALDIYGQLGNLYGAQMAHIMAGVTISDMVLRRYHCEQLVYPRHHWWWIRPAASTGSALPGRCSAGRGRCRRPTMRAPPDA